jgi:hypothetical protein
MSWFGSQKRCSVTAAGPTAIRVSESGGKETVVDVATLDWLSFVQIGDDTTPVYEGWWVLGHRDGATAINVDCGAIDPLLRDGPLADVADRVVEKTLVFTADRPAALSGQNARSGVVHLDRTGAAALTRAGSQERVQSVRDFPTIL